MPWGSEAPQDLLADCHSASKEDMAAGPQNPEALLSLKGAHCQGSAAQQNLLQDKELNTELSKTKERQSIGPRETEKSIMTYLFPLNSDFKNQC